ncbi:MAG: hypothetical protein QM775_27235 [Pirellulales bacterium]
MPAETLSFSDDVGIGSTVAGSISNLRISGDGSLVVNNLKSGGAFIVGGISATSSNGMRVTADFSELANLTVNLNNSNGTFRVAGTSSATGSTNVSALYLAKTSQITADRFYVGDGGANALQLLILGSTQNTLNVDLFSVGNGLRDQGGVSFAGTTGTLVMRDSTGTGRAAFDLTATGGGTGSTGVLSYFDVTGHNADLLLGAVRVGSQNRQHQVAVRFAWDRGTLDMTSLELGRRSSNGSTSGQGLLQTDATMTLGSAASTSADVVTILNGIDMAISNSGRCRAARK